MTELDANTPAQDTSSTQTKVRNGRMPSRFLFLVVFGIGTRKPDSIGRHVEAMGRLKDSIVAMHYPDMPQFAKVDFRSLDWRQEVYQKLGNVADTIDAITLPSVEKIRDVVNHRLLDVMLYLMPFRDTILRALQQGLNAAYLDYLTEQCEADDNFDPSALKVVLYAHSLGSVLCYDLLSEPGALHFPTHALYALGSPLGLFLALRGFSLGKLPAVFPKGSAGAKYLFNILHPNDPLTYRIEPFIDIDLQPQVPVVLPSCRAARPRPAGVLGAISNSIFSGTLRQPSPTKSVPQLSGSTTTTRDPSSPLSPNSSINLTVHSLPAAYHGRFDLQLIGEMGSTISPYVSAVSAHKGYWESEDVMYFALGQCLRDVFLGGSACGLTDPLNRLCPTYNNQSSAATSSTVTSSTATSSTVTSNTATRSTSTSSQLQVTDAKVAQDERNPGDTSTQ